MMRKLSKDVAITRCLHWCGTDSMVWNHHDMKSCFADSQNKSSVAQLASASDCYTSGYQEVGSSSLPGGGCFLFCLLHLFCRFLRLISRGKLLFMYSEVLFCHDYVLETIKENRRFLGYSHINGFFRLRPHVLYEPALCCPYWLNFPVLQLLTYGLAYSISILYTITRKKQQDLNHKQKPTTSQLCRHTNYSTLFSFFVYTAHTASFSTFLSHKAGVAVIVKV